MENHHHNKCSRSAVNDSLFAGDGLLFHSVIQQKKEMFIVVVVVVFVAVLLANYANYGNMINAYTSHGQQQQQSRQRLNSFIIMIINFYTYC